LAPKFSEGRRQPDVSGPFPDGIIEILGFRRETAVKRGGDEPAAAS